jgi:DNA invertase Pin-like site-specific DNA recombinase
VDSNFNEPHAPSGNFDGPSRAVRPQSEEMRPLWSGMLLDGYVRVSQVAGRSGESFISPAVQREQVEGWAKLHGHLVGRIFEELDQSGARSDRPLFMAAVERVERRESNGIVVAKLDRFGRSLADGLAAIDRITRAGGTFVSVRDGLDLSTDTGRLVLRIMLSMAEWELDRIRSNWETAAERAIRRGVRIGRPPFGYRRKRDGRLEPDPQLGPVAREVFERRAAGEPIPGIAAALTNRGITTAGGKPVWTSNTIYGMVKSRVYLGQLSWREHVNPKAHEPPVSRQLWEQARRPRRHVPDHDAMPALLRGLLRCCGCRRVMTTYIDDRGTQRERQQYGCVNPTSIGWCPQPARVTGPVVEPYVEALFWQELERAPRSGQAQVRKLEQGFAEQEEELARYRDSLALRKLGVERFERGIDVRTGRLERAILELDAARAKISEPQLPPAKKLRAGWPQMELEERCHALGEVFDCVFVVRGRGRPEERLHACRRGEAPLDLPRPRPRTGETLRGFEVGDASTIRLSQRNNTRWSEERLRGEVEPFLAGSEEWPSYNAFQLAGLGRAHAQVQRRGGTKKWAQKYGLRYEPLRRPLGAWPESRIRAELADFLAGLTTWPTVREFQAAGRSMLRVAVKEGRGAVSWAEEFSLPLEPRQRRANFRWTDDRIVAAVRDIAGDSGVWPGRLGFLGADQSGLYHAILRRGGQDRWARRVGLPRRARYRG